MSQSEYKQVSPSPYNDRISRIQQKLINIQTGSENERNQRMDNSENKLRLVEQQFLEYQEQINIKLNGLKENVVKVHRIIEEGKTEKEQIFEQNMKQLIAVETGLSNSLDQCAGQRKENEGKFLRTIEEKVNFIKNEIIKENKVRTENIANLNQCLESDFSKMMSDIKTEITDREEMDQTIMKKMTEEILKINQLIQLEKQSREDGEQTIFDMLRDVVNKVKLEIESERKNRETSEETILNLLEDTCNKLNAISTN